MRPEPMDIAIKVNGRPRELSVEPRVTLVDALRDELGLTGTKKGCAASVARARCTSTGGAF
jgi:xanthine dehydrogenase YagT iron-sulfur-binding subunit